MLLTAFSPVNMIYNDLLLPYVNTRHCLWILGNERTLSTSESIWKSIVCDAKDRKCFFNVEEDKELAEFIIQVKKELDQSDELLDSASFLFQNVRWKVPTLCHRNLPLHVSCLSPCSNSFDYYL